MEYRKATFTEELRPVHTFQRDTWRTFDTFEEMQKFISDNRPIPVIQIESGEYLRNGWDDRQPYYRLHFKETQQVHIQDVLNTIYECGFDASFTEILETLEKLYGIPYQESSLHLQLADLIRECVVLDRKSHYPKEE